MTNMSDYTGGRYISQLIREIRFFVKWRRKTQPTISNWFKYKSIRNDIIKVNSLSPIADNVILYSNTPSSITFEFSFPHFHTPTYPYTHIYLNYCKVPYQLQYSLVKFLRVEHHLPTLYIYRQVPIGHANLWFFV